MADNTRVEKMDAQVEQSPQLEQGTYEIIRNRLLTQGRELSSRLEQLNAQRKQVFGSIDFSLLATERIATGNNCVPRDMTPIGNRFLFGYNVHLGLRSETLLDDVFAIYTLENRSFTEQGLDMLQDEIFLNHFRDLYRYYRDTRFVKFAVRGPYLYMVFRIGQNVQDIKTFKWLIKDDGALRYVDNRSDHEFAFPCQHEFEWVRTTRDMHRTGHHPHISINDEVFVETIGGDLTIKIEDNTEIGEGIYAEPVDDPDQTLDDAEIYYADEGNLLLLKIKPYKEKAFRYIVYSKKVQQARRIDTIKDSCVLLPDDHGVIFANGFFLQTGEHKEFEIAEDDMMFEQRVQAPNGEDYLFVFYNRDSGTYVLLSYNLIEQAVQTPIICHGFSLFENGDLVYFKAAEEPKKTHVLQIWQTPYILSGYEAAEKQDSLLYKIGNKEIVRCMAACRSVINLVQREDTYANLYLDVVKYTTEILDAYFWLDNRDAFNLEEPLGAVRATANSAIEEFEKVVRIRQHTQGQIKDVSGRTRDLINHIHGMRFENIDQYVKALAGLRKMRGESITLKDLRYADLALIEELEQVVTQENERMAGRCVEFLLQPEALTPYREQVEAQKQRIEVVTKVTEGREIEKEIVNCGSELEMLIDMVSNLEIEDATQRTGIIDNISVIFALLNQVRAQLKNRIQELASVEGVAEFASQMKLIDQAVINYLDVCDKPEKCEDFLSKVMIQLEELEGKFADFDEFVGQLGDKRTEVYDAFQNRKLKLVEARNRRADGLARSAERILKGIRTRAESMDSVEAINGYFAADIMIDKVRNVIEQLTGMDDSVRADDIQARLKTIREDAVRRLKDRHELFVEGENVIAMGQHHFSVNTQTLDLTAILRDDAMYLHLTGTNFFEKITDADFLQTRDVWNQETVSENAQVYRGEYLAYLLYRQLQQLGATPGPDEVLAMDADALRAYIQQFMGPRYNESYVKGVHDADAALLLRTLLNMHAHIGLLRYPSRARALARYFWACMPDQAFRQAVETKLGSYGLLYRTFEGNPEQTCYIAELNQRLSAWCTCLNLTELDAVLLRQAAEYLFYVLCADQTHPISAPAARIFQAFYQELDLKNIRSDFEQALDQVRVDEAVAFALVSDWIHTFVRNKGLDEEYGAETVAIVITGSFDQSALAEADVQCTIQGMTGGHSVIEKGEYTFHYNRFMLKLERFAQETVPRFITFQQTKQRLLDEARRDMRLDEFMPRVLTSFVRNKLIDSVYLPLIGDNLAKQIGVVGAATRTDRMGMLLLISPPGYGKTTLMEYIANRLGIIFMKINGPAIGHRVTSLDPVEAPNAASREELHKLNLSLEMGDNVMIYLDDIQHCNPEFLQKFISLCDAQRKIEGVYKGRTRTYDLRGKKVTVVMAGNPYTESGEMFKVPDMLSNRADTYNLGDIIGDKANVFKLSYLENALTSNPALSKLASRSRKDIHGIIRIAETGLREGVDLESNFSAEEVNELVTVMQKLIRVRDVILTVNQQYIRSAGQADEYRTEPAFKLQGSYRNMNRIAEKVQAVMNEQELETLIFDHYQVEAQTLTTGAEANLLKFRELLGTLSDQDQERWTAIKKTFNRNKLLHGADGEDKIGRIILHLSTFQEGLQDLREAVSQGASLLSDARCDNRTEMRLSQETLDQLTQLLDQHNPAGNGDRRRITRLLEQQFEQMQGWVEPGREDRTAPETIQKRIAQAADNYRVLLEQLTQTPPTESPDSLPLAATEAKADQRL